MPRPSDPYPDRATLTARLAAALDGRGPERGALTVLDREPSPYSSTFPSEVVTCRFDDGGECRVLCKYGPTEYTSGHGHRGGVPREVQAYRRVLGPLGLRPRCYGSYISGSADRVGMSAMFGSIRSASSLARAAMSGCGSAT